VHREGDATDAAARPSAADGEPFDLPGGPDAVLLLHGLTGSPFEVRPVAEALAEQGMRCLAPRLAGHGGEVRDLARVGWREWVWQAGRELEKLRGARRTFLVGCSMGALVALAAAQEHPDRVDGLALLAPALRLQPAGALAGWLVRHTHFGKLLPPIPKAGSDVRDPEMRARNPCMTSIPVAAVGQLQELARHVDRLLPGVAAPALVLAGGRDHTVRLSGARRIARRIGSAPARLVVLPDSFHLLGIDVERDLVADEVSRFFAALPASSRKE